MEDFENNVVTKKSRVYFLFVPFGIFFLYTICLFIFCDYWKKGFIFLVSTSFGLILKYGDVRFTCTFESIYKNYNFYRMRILLIVFLFANISSTFVEKINHCPIFSDKCKNFSYFPNQIPIGFSLNIGSFLFGIGMIFSGCCASETLINLGAGNIKALIVLLSFIIGSTFAIRDPIFNRINNLLRTKEPVTFHYSLMWIILAVIYLITIVLDYLKQKIFGYKDEDIDYLFLTKPLGLKYKENESKIKKWIYHLIFAILLGLSFGIFYLCFGSMIGVSGVFPIIGANFLKIFGVDVKKWKYFRVEPKRNYFNYTIFNNDIYLILGSFCNSVITGTFGKTQENSYYKFIRAIIGGFLMGIGSIMASGCNIGGMTSGISASSLHGIIWMEYALIGSWVGVMILKIIENTFKIKEDDGNKENKENYGIVNEVYTTSRFQDEEI